MSRDNRHPGNGEMVDNARLNRMVRDAAREVGIPADVLSAEVHRIKEIWDKGDFSYRELVAIAEDIKNGK